MRPTLLLLAFWALSLGGCNPAWSVDRIPISAGFAPDGSCWFRFGETTVAGQTKLREPTRYHPGASVECDADHVTDRGYFKAHTMLIGFRGTWPLRPGTYGMKGPREQRPGSAPSGPSLTGAVIMHPRLHAQGAFIDALDGVLEITDSANGLVMRFNGRGRRDLLM